MDGSLIGVFGSKEDLKSAFLASIGKKSETEGIVVYQRNDAGRKFSLLDDASFPDKIQGYSRIATIADHALYLFPNEGKLLPSDGELAVLLDSVGLVGNVVVVDGTQPNITGVVKSSFKGLSLSNFPIEERSAKSSVIDFSQVKPRSDYLKDQPLVYIDRAFNVKGVGLVVLGFVLSGSISVHDKLRLLPSESGKVAEIKGIQVSDEDQQKVGRGIRVGLSLKGVELKDLSKVSWLDGGSLKTASKVEFQFKQSNYYKQPTIDRDLHIQVNGEILVASISQGTSPVSRIAKLSSEIPVWEGMPLSVLDLNSKLLRVAGGGLVRG
ncbi:MAG: EF-Tu/IF-2/RF-3 family GTPase [Thaumarchaeota archaeon]|nr:EF-Tu/IF-2/RF-3 family GTPase [Nitrososphaerota archaeon]